MAELMRFEVILIFVFFIRKEVFVDIVNGRLGDFDLFTLTEINASLVANSDSRHG